MNAASSDRFSATRSLAITRGTSGYYYVQSSALCGCVGILAWDNHVLLAERLVKPGYHPDKITDINRLLVTFKNSGVRYDYRELRLRLFNERLELHHISQVATGSEASNIRGSFPDWPRERLRISALSEFVYH